MPIVIPNPPPALNALRQGLRADGHDDLVARAEVAKVAVERTRARVAGEDVELDNPVD